MDTCHATAARSLDKRDYYPFTVPTSELDPATLTGYTPLDFLWAISFHGKQISGSRGLRIPGSPRYVAGVSLFYPGIE
ncbi:MAG: hypothetical protein GY717_11550 [Rhodobacteraceae bacterium]|nr:hypothetical protein [Paracoccaceae bacterium]